jgi:hypothetical protein
MTFVYLANRIACRLTTTLAAVARIDNPRRDRVNAPSDRYPNSVKSSVVFSRLTRNGGTLRVDWGLNG